MILGELHAEITGNGDVLVLLHGNGEDRHIFDQMIPVLGVDRKVVALDTRAHGESPRGDGPLTVQRLAHDLELALDSVGVKTVDLVGYSDGGNIALMFAAAHPDRVRSMVVFGSNLYPSGLRRFELCVLRLGLIRLRLLSKFNPRYIPLAERWALMTTQPQISHKSLKRIKARTLVMAGQHDIVRESHTILIANTVPNAKLAIVEGASHAFPLKEPLRFARIVVDFLAASAKSNQNLR